MRGEITLEIAKQKGGKLTEQDAYSLAALLIRAGYTVGVRYAGKERGWIVNAEDKNQLLCL